MSIDIYLITLIFSVLVASISQIFLKRGAKKEYSCWLREYVNVNVIVGYSLLLISTALTILAFRGTEYKNGPIIESLGYVFIMLLSRIFFKETITKKKIWGNILILIGIFIYYM